MQKADVSGEGAQVSGVVGDPFQFQSDGAEQLRAGRGLRSGKGFQVHAPGGGVADCGIARQGLHIVDSAQAGIAAQGGFDAPVLIAKLDLQMKNVLAVGYRDRDRGCRDRTRAAACC